MDWDKIKAVLAEIVAYFKKVFEYFYKPEDDAAADENVGA